MKTHVRKRPLVVLGHQPWVDYVCSSTLMPSAGVDPIAVEDIQYIVYKLKEKNIGILITDHNAPETLSITDRAYMLFEGKILFQGTSEELAVDPVVREKYLGRNFIFHRKKFD